MGDHGPTSRALSTGVRRGTARQVVGIFVYTVLAHLRCVARRELTLPKGQSASCKCNPARRISEKSVSAERIATPWLSA